MDQKTAETLIGLLVVIVSGTFGKIIWDWLVNKRTEARQDKMDVRQDKSDVKHSGDCERLQKLETQFHAAHLQLAQDVARIDGNVATINTNIDWIKHKLDLNGNGKS